MLNLDNYRQKLLSLRDEYSQRIDALQKDLQHQQVPLEKDSAELASQLENEDVLEALDGEARGIVVQINHALQCIEDGSYGICSSCGEVISEARLNAVPYTCLCIDCAEDQDR